MDMAELSRKVYFLFLLGLIYLFLFYSVAISSGYAASADPAADPQFETGKRAILARTGCYLVDYSFVETEAVKPGYTLDRRVYDVNRNKSVKEWIFAEHLSPTRIKLQHVLFATDLAGKPKRGQSPEAHW